MMTCANFPHYAIFHHYALILRIFTVQRNASAVYDAAVVRLSVRLSVCPSVYVPHAGIVSKRLNVESRNQRHTIAQGL